MLHQQRQQQAENQHMAPKSKSPVRPEEFVERSLKWKQQQERKLMVARERKEKSKDPECRFKPEINANPNNCQPDYSRMNSKSIEQFLQRMD